MSLDFAIKDFYRKRDMTLPYVLIIVLVIGLTEFLIYYTNSIGLNPLATNYSQNMFYSSGGIHIIYSNFNLLIISLILVFSFVIIMVILSTIIITKKRDIAIMKSLGSIPRNLYNFFLTEIYIIFFIGFIIGIVIGISVFGVFSLIYSAFNFSILFQVDWFFTPILFLACIIGIFIFPGYVLRKIGTYNVVRALSMDIPYFYNAKQKFTIVPTWLSRLGYNVKIAITNTIRRKGEFKRYLIVITLISLIIFTLALGIIVLNSSSQTWLKKSQGNNIIAVGHVDVLNNYSLMYEMFSRPDILVSKEDINFLDARYIFNSSDIEQICNLSYVKRVDERLLNLWDVKELDGYQYLEGGGYKIIGQSRTAIIPIVGINRTSLIQDFEIEGEFFQDPNLHMVIGDGLAYNFFDSAFDQSMRIEELNHVFHISGVIIDSFYSGNAGYVDISNLREDLNFTQQEINLLLIEIDDANNQVQLNNLKEIIQNTLGESYSYINLGTAFQKNSNYLVTLALFPIVLVCIMAIISVLILYNYQKSGIMYKAKDFLIMKAIGSSNKNLMKIINLEGILVLLPAIAISLGIGMILNSIVLFEKVHLPPLSIPFIVIVIILIFFLLFSYLSTIPLMKRLRKFSIKDFEIY